MYIYELHKQKAQHSGRFRSFESGEIGPGCSSSTRSVSLSLMFIFQVNRLIPSIRVPVSLSFASTNVAITFSCFHHQQEIGSVPMDSRSQNDHSSAIRIRMGPHHRHFIVGLESMHPFERGSGASWKAGKSKHRSPEQKMASEGLCLR